MKAIYLITLIIFTSSVTYAESYDDKRPKSKGYNYKRHYRRVGVKDFISRVFHTGCHGKQNVH